MNTILACRLEVSPADNLELDAAMLDWLAEMPPIESREMWLRHSYGLVGNMTGALRLLDDLSPGASWAVMTVWSEDGRAYVATILPAGGQATHSGFARDAANALCAAMVRAQPALDAIAANHAA